ncbi:calcium calmodulin-dependent protein kinase type 1G [Irineochytrium annulatum]|nr:calcium calmodulin-dependent protein kinase type 1G [Irineochytrium annulatum]
MELVTGGELFDDIVAKGKYTEQETAIIVHRILLAIDYLHSIGIAHRDLKVTSFDLPLSTRIADGDLNFQPENLLLSDKSPNAKIMISDFGLSKIFSTDEVMRTACGTPGYVAPEVLKRQGYGREIDLWSLGVITYILLCGYPPFYDQNNVELFKQIMAGRFEFDRPWWDTISENAENLPSAEATSTTRPTHTNDAPKERPFSARPPSTQSQQQAHPKQSQQYQPKSQAPQQQQQQANSHTYTSVFPENTQQQYHTPQPQQYHAQPSQYRQHQHQQQPQQQSRPSSSHHNQHPILPPVQIDHHPSVVSAAARPSSARTSTTIRQPQPQPPPTVLPVDLHQAYGGHAHQVPQHHQMHAQMQAQQMQQQQLQHQQMYARGYASAIPQQGQRVAHQYGQQGPALIPSVHRSQQLSQQPHAQPMHPQQYQGVIHEELGGTMSGPNFLTSAGGPQQPGYAYHHAVYQQQGILYPAHNDMAMAGAIDQAGRPLGSRTSLDDSGCVMSSNESMNGRGGKGGARWSGWMGVKWGW